MAFSVQTANTEEGRMCSRFTVCLWVLLGLSLTAWCSRDAIEIVDLETGARKSVPYRADLNCQERVVLRDDEEGRFFTLRRENRAYTLRTISYDGETLEEKPLPGFACDGESLCALSPQGRSIVFHDFGDGGLSLYDIATASKAGIIPELTRHIERILWLSDTQVIVSVSQYRDEPTAFSSAVLLVDVPAKTAEVLYKDTSLIWGGKMCSLSPDRQYLAFFCEKTGELKVLRLGTRDVFTATTRKEDEVEYLRWSPDSTLLAYHLPTRGRVKVYSVPEKKEVVTKTWEEMDGVVFGLFFLDADRLACETGDIELACGPSGITESRAQILNARTGQMEKPLPWKLRGRALPIAEGNKLLCVVDDDTDYYVGASDSILPTVDEGIANVFSLPAALAAGLQGAFSRAGIAIIAVESGQKEVLKASGPWPEILLFADDAKQHFKTLRARVNGFQVRTISYRGEVRDAKRLPAFQTYPERRELALSPSGDSIAYYDMMSNSLRLLDVASGKSAVLIPDIEINLSKVLWKSENEVLLVIWSDSSDAGTLANTIASLNVDEKTLQVIYQGTDLHGGFACFALSPCRRFLLFTDQPSEAMSWPNLQILDLSTKQVSILVAAKEDTDIRQACWSPDGSRVAYHQSVRTKLSEPTKTDFEEVEKAVKEEMRGGSPDQKRLQELIDSVSGPRYAVDTNLNMYSMVEKESITITKLPDGTSAYYLGFLDENRLICRTRSREEEETGSALSVLNIRTRQVEKVFEDQFSGEILPVAGGKIVLCELGSY